MPSPDKVADEANKGAEDDALQFDKMSNIAVEGERASSRTDSLTREMPVSTFSKESRAGFQRLASQPLYVDPQARSYRR